MFAVALVALEGEDQIPLAERLFNVQQQHLFAVEPANNGALVALIVSVVWTIGFPILSFILFKTRATLDR